jgi:adenylate cyclase
MKRKIAAIMAADVEGYSRLVAEDEEETLRRLASYRSVIDDFIAKASGRIFNTAGDAVLAEFASSVEAVRAAIDIQESLRTRNLAYPPSRQMNFRIGITVGDVVEREGDLLGDAVNIAARLEGLADAGGICVSRTVFEQVANKLSVRFSDIGEQLVKNIPTPVHAYAVAIRSADGQMPASKQPRKTAARATIVAAVAAIVLGGAALAYWAAVSGSGPTSTAQNAGVPAPPQAVSAAAVRPAPDARVAALAPPAGTLTLNETKVRTLAVQQGIPLPQAIRLMAPSPSVPKYAAQYIGAWGGEARWNGVGRQLILVVTSVDETTAAGFLANGPPNARTSNQFPASVRPFSGTVADTGLKFDIQDGRWQYAFKLRPDGYLEGHLKGPDDLRASIAIERIQ